MTPEQMNMYMPQQLPSFTSGNNQHSGSIVLLTNPENDLFKFELFLRGMVLDEQGNPKQVGDPLMNEKGISSLLGLLSTTVSQNTVMSNVDDKGIGILMELNADTVAQLLMMNRRRYEIKDFSIATTIMNAYVNKTYLTLRRPYEEGDRRFWKGSQQEITSTIKSDTQRKGILGLIGLKK